jgi:hypothetical protein
MLLPLLLFADLPPPTPPELAQVVDLATVAPGGPQVGQPGRFVFTPGSKPDDDLGHWAVEAEGPGDAVRCIYFAPGEDDRGLWDAAPIIVEGTLVQLYHPARDGFVAVVELRLEGARRVW